MTERVASGLCGVAVCRLAVWPSGRLAVWIPSCHCIPSYQINCLVALCELRHSEVALLLSFPQVFERYATLRNLEPADF